MRLSIPLMGLSIICARSAAAELGTRLPHPREVHSAAETERLVRFYAGCITGGDLTDARALVWSKSDSPEAADSAKRLFAPRSDCLSKADAGSPELHAPISLLRGYIARALYLRTNPKTPPSGLVTVVPPTTSTTTDLDGLFACIVAANPAAGDALVRSLPDAPEERAAIDAIKPAITPCAPPLAAFAMTKPILRAGVAVALYRLAEPRP